MRLHSDEQYLKKAPNYTNSVEEKMKKLGVNAGLQKKAQAPPGAFLEDKRDFKSHLLD